MARKKLNFQWNDEGLRRQFRDISRKYGNKAKVRKISKPAAKIARSHLLKAAIQRGDTAKKTPPGYFKPKTRIRDGAAAVYYPGNAKRSMKTFSFRKSYFMHVGAKVNPSSSASGNFSSGYKVEGFYNFFLQYGTRHIRARRHMSKGIQQAKAPVEMSLRMEMNKDLRRTAIQTKR